MINTGWLRKEYILFFKLRGKYKRGRCNTVSWREKWTWKFIRDGSLQRCRACSVLQSLPNNNSYKTIQRLFRAHFRLHDIRQCPSANVIKQWVRKLRQLVTQQTDDMVAAGASGAKITLSVFSAICGSGSTLISTQTGCDSKFAPIQYAAHIEN
ncbi:hypothetical protein ANN_19233 [Periplaneta americana]|uniref:DUF4817 domain-containing protein n=1 Tax=Periplaneta americana TaxID=6978 RepID=A0ABQ8S9N4_PERAM|nr:hypothetical protein ANN_19233 [Periplaneta americana]